MKRGDLRHQSVVEMALLIRLRIMSAGDDLIKNEEARGIETGTGRAQIKETLDEQAGAREQQKRERHLRDDEERAHARAVQSAGRALRALLQRLTDIRARDLQCRY
jgi:hypothetical protein